PFPALDMTTTVSGLLFWRDFHPLEGHLAQLHGSGRAPPSAPSEAGRAHHDEAHATSDRLITEFPAACFESRGRGGLPPEPDGAIRAWLARGRCEKKRAAGVAGRADRLSRSIS